MQLDPTRKACSSYALLTSFINLKAIGLIGVIVIAAYYGWPIVEAIILILPLPDPKESLESIYSFFGSITGFFSGLLGGSSSNGSSGAGPGYSSNLEA